VDLHEYLVEGLLALVVATAQASAALAADGIQLIYKDDARRGLLRAVEEVAHTAGADADQHLYELRAGHREEGDVRLASHRLGEQRLTSARRADQQHALGQLAAQTRVALRILEELHHLLQIGLGLIHTCHISKCRLGLAAHVDTGAALAETEDAALGLAGAAAEIPDATDEQQDGQELEDQAKQEAAVGIVLDLDLDATLLEQRHGILAGQVGGGGIEPAARVVGLIGMDRRLEGAGDRIVVEGDGHDVLGLDLLHEEAVAD